MGDWSVTEWITAGVFLSVSTLGAAFWIQTLRASIKNNSTRFWTNRSASVQWGLVDVLTVAFVWIGSQALATSFLFQAYGITTGQEISAETSARMALMSGIAQLICTTACFVWLIRRYQHSDRDFGLDPNQWANGIRAGLKAFCMWVPLVWAVQNILVEFIEYTHPSFERIKGSSELFTLIDVWITAVIVAPILEEILFRCILQGWLQRFRHEALQNPNPLIAGGPDLTTDMNRSADDPPKIHLSSIFVTSILFGLAHYSQGPAPYSLFVLSLGLGFVYQRTGNVIACITMHMTLNFITMTLFTFEQFFP